MKLHAMANDDTGLWEVHSECGLLCSVESESTAAVFAASYDLLAALDLFMRDATADDLPSAESPISIEAVLAGASAIAKAKG